MRKVNRGITEVMPAIIPLHNYWHLIWIFIRLFVSSQRQAISGLLKGNMAQKEIQEERGYAVGEIINQQTSDTLNGTLPIKCF